MTSFQADADIQDALGGSWREPPPVTASVPTDNLDSEPRPFGVRGDGGIER